MAYKFRGFDILAAPMAKRLAQQGLESGIFRDADTIAPIPSTALRNWRRGYDPATLLARETAKISGIPLRNLLRRIRSTPPQSSLPARERPGNVAGVFRAAKDTRRKSVVLIDDVMTTGSTAYAAARALLDAGAVSIRLLVFARTPHPDDFRHPEPA